MPREALTLFRTCRYLNDVTSFQEVIYPWILSFLVSHTSYCKPFRTHSWQSTWTLHAVCFWSPWRGKWGDHTAPTKMPTIIMAIILGTFQGQKWGLSKHAVSWEYQTALGYWRFTRRTRSGFWSSRMLRCAACDNTHRRFEEAWRRHPQRVVGPTRVIRTDQPMKTKTLRSFSTSDVLTAF